MSKLFKTTALVLVVGLFLVLMPLQVAQAADIWTSIADILTEIATTVLLFPLVIGITILSQIAPILAYLFFIICTTLLSWTTEVTFGTIPLTHGGIIDAALPITTGFVNIGFILVLVFIALSTILRLENYGLKKLLPKFITIAILINFVPVICGIVIDLANVVTLSFFKNNDFGQLMGDAFKNTPIGTLFTTQLVLNSPFGDWLTAAQRLIGLSGIIGMIVKAAVATFFGFFAGGVVLIYALLFIFRVIAIWILVIMAPIAWFCWILPDTQKFYKMWENYFIQWAFVGAIMGFFLWMGTRLMNIVTTFPQISMTSTGTPDWVQGLLNIIPVYQILTYGSVLTFLIVGFVLSMKMSGGGTETIMKWGEKGFKSAGDWATTKGKGWAKDKVANSLGGKGVQNIANRMATAKTPGAGSTNIFGKAFAGAINPLYAGVRAAGKAAGPGILESQRMDSEKAEKEVEKSSVSSTLSSFRNATDGPSRTGYLNRLAKNNDIDEARLKGLTDNEIKNTANEARKYDGHKDIISAMPQLEEDRLKKLTPLGWTSATTPAPYADLVTAYREEIINKTKPNRAGNLSGSVYERHASATHAGTGTKIFNNPELLESIVKGWDGRHYGKLYETHGPKAIEAVEDRIKQLSSDASLTPDAWLALNNPKLNSYRKTSPGRAMFSLP